MSSDNAAIEFCEVWKKYSREAIFHRSLREDLINIFKGRKKTELAKDEFWALKQVNFAINAGETVGLHGPNGAGKTTILKLIAGVTYPTKGTVRTKGRIAPLLEIGAGFHPDLTGRENIFVNGTILGMGIRELRRKIDSIIEFSEIWEFIDMPVKKYSSGMYLRLAFSIAIHSEVDIYLIDEIIAVGDESFQKKCIKKIIELREAGKTLLVVSHSLATIQQLVHRTIFIQKEGMGLSN